MTAPVIIIITRPPRSVPTDPLPPLEETTYETDLEGLKAAKAKINEMIEALP